MKKAKKFDVEHEKQYLEFLRKRLDSQNFKNNVSKEEYDKTKEKFEKAKLIMKLLGNSRE